MISHPSEDPNRPEGVEHILPSERKPTSPWWEPISKRIHRTACSIMRDEGIESPSQALVEARRRYLLDQ
jgi:hypothetical protein